ncbi:MAG: hypothetical protein IPG73_10790 [Ignavibacteria bacterium]|nr:hypothetical protein [Ignavibacteria bacterium]
MVRRVQRLSLGSILIGTVILLASFGVQSQDEAALFSTKKQVGTISFQITKDSSAHVDLMKYKVTGSAPLSRIHGDTLLQSSDLMAVKITPWPGYQPSTISVPKQGITDQPVLVILIND